ncbi:MAG: TIGR04282 family arsenosugar biosynthesis glycosyltransferase [Acidobacteriota bacterium]
MPSRRRLLLFTKPAREGRVKTRLIGDLTAAEAAALHGAFLDDLLDRLRGGDFELTIAWALDPEDPIPAGPLPGIRQEGDDLGERLYRALSRAARDGDAVMALGSDHPTVSLSTIHRGFEAVESRTPVAMGPAEDGGYYLIALRSDAVHRRIFEEIDWSTERVLPQTLERCREIGLEVETLPLAMDVDTPDDLRRLVSRMSCGDLGCPRTRDLLRTWQRLPMEGTT